VLTQLGGLASVVHDGVTGPLGAMPPVGNTWSRAELVALAAYVKKHIYKSAPPGATGGG
jgi:mono/diheme cytochrome c family protein